MAIERGNVPSLVSIGCVVLKLFDPRWRSVHLCSPIGYEDRDRLRGLFSKDLDELSYDRCWLRRWSVGNRHWSKSEERRGLAIWAAHVV